MVDIQGDKIYLRSFTRAEYHQYWQSYIADPIMDFNPYVYDEKRVDESYEAILKKESWYLVLGIFSIEGTPIGSISLKRINYDKCQCELGIVLANDKHKGLGYGTEAINLAIDYAFNILKLKCIYADTMGSNFKMQRVFDKLGFKFINKEEKFYNMKDRLEDKLDYVLDKSI